MKYNRHNKAFTLAEVILAIGIMGMGMVFAACLFPVAIQESNASYDDVVGKMVCESGLAIALSQIEKNDITSYSEFTNATPLILADPTPLKENGTDYTGSPELSNTRFTSVPYMVSKTPGIERGFIVFCKYASDQSTIAILSYRANNGEAVTGVLLAGDVTVANNVYTYTVSTGTPLKGGILFENGQFARILKVNGTNAAILDRTVPTGTNIKAFITNNSVTNLNPTMFGILTKTGL